MMCKKRGAVYVARIGNVYFYGGSFSGALKKAAAYRWKK